MVTSFDVQKHFSSTETVLKNGEPLEQALSFLQICTKNVRL